MRMKSIPRFLGYFVTDDGWVWSAQRRLVDGRSWKGRWLKPGRDGGGYLNVDLGRGHSYLIHRLVLEAFVGPCPQGMGACHNNGIRTDNRLKNLRWDTPAANHLDTVRHGNCPFLKDGFPHAKGENCGRAKLTESQVRQIVQEFNTGLFTQTDIGQRHGVARSNVGAIISGKTWRHLGARDNLTFIQEVA